jgi:hypothetical protein
VASRFILAPCHQILSVRPLDKELDSVALFKTENFFERVGRDAPGKRLQAADPGSSEMLPPPAVASAVPPSHPKFNELSLRRYQC